MAGAGKTSCALEVVYHYHAINGFNRFVWYRAPEPDSDIRWSLQAFALCLERQLSGLTMVHMVETPQSLARSLPSFTELLKRERVLLVLDNMESLLSHSGHWRDERWGMLLNAMLSKGVLSRTILTSRILPAEFPATAEAIPIHALSLSETALLFRQLPNLGGLLEGSTTGVTLENGRNLARRALHLVQGHPKLVEFTELLASDANRLAHQLERAEAAQNQRPLNTFFATGQTGFDAEAFTETLHEWTLNICGSLPEDARTFLFPLHA